MKTTQYLLTDKWINKMCETMQYHSAVKKNAVLLHARTQMNLADLIVGGMSQRQHILYDSLAMQYIKQEMS